MTTIADLISKAKLKSTRLTLPEQAKADVLTAIDYNRGAHRDNKLSAAEVLQSLREQYGVGMSEPTFRRWCKDTLGHTFGGK